MTCEPVGPDGLHVMGTPIALLPWPNDVRVDANALTSLHSGTVVQEKRIDLPILIDELRDDLEEATGGVWHGARGWDGEVRMRLDDTLGDRAYTIDTADGTMTIAGGGEAGLRAGVQTARQLIRGTAGLLPVMHIADEPAYEVRGYYLDVTRGRVPTLERLKEWARDLELRQYNQLHLYIEHSFAFPWLSEAWRGLDPLRPEDIMAFDAYCLDHGIELVPSISTFGHLYTTLRTHGLRHLGEFPEDADRPFSFVERMAHHTLNITLDEAYGLSTRLIDDYMPLFSSHRFNLCADETFDLGRGRSHAEAERTGVGAMYVRYVNRLCAHIAAQGHEPMLWADVALAHPETLGDLDAHATLLNWQYEPDPDDAKTAALAAAGVRQYVCPAVHGWNRTLPLLDRAWRNIAAMAGHGIRHEAAGFLVTDWGDYGHVNDPRLSEPGMMMAAECAWNGGTAGYDDVLRRIGLAMFADPTGALMRAWDVQARSAALTWHDAVRLLELDMGEGAPAKDALATFAWSPDEAERAVAGCDDADTARRAFLTALAPRLERVPDRTGALRTVQEAMAAAAVRPTSPAGRALMRACAGQDLLDEAGWRLAADRGILPDRGSMRDATAVAGALERWFEDYRDLWRETGRDAELSRVGAVVWRLADLLRGRDAEAA